MSRPSSVGSLAVRIGVSGGIGAGGRASSATRAASKSFAFSACFFAMSYASWSRLILLLLDLPDVVAFLFPIGDRLHRFLVGGALAFAGRRQRNKKQRGRRGVAGCRNDDIDMALDGKGGGGKDRPGRRCRRELERYRLWRTGCGQGCRRVLPPEMHQAPVRTKQRDRLRVNSSPAEQGRSLRGIG